MSVFTTTIGPAWPPTKPGSGGSPAGETNDSPNGMTASMTESTQSPPGQSVQSGGSSSGATVAIG